MTIRSRSHMAKARKTKTTLTGPWYVKTPGGSVLGDPYSTPGSAEHAAMRMFRGAGRSFHDWLEVHDRFGFVLRVFEKPQGHKPYSPTQFPAIKPTGYTHNPASRGRYAIIDYGRVVPSLGFRYAVQSLPDRPLQVPSGVTVVVKNMTQAGARAMADHLNGQAQRGLHMPRQPVTRLDNAVLRKGKRGAIFQVRRSNPVLAVMGGNPPQAAGDDIVATWANIEYCRPDDPDGKRAVRVHEFPDGFVATPLADGSILLRHPRGLNLWTRR